MELQAIRTRQAIVAQANAAAEHTLRSKLAEIALLPGNSPAQVISKLEVLIGAGLVDPALPLTQQIVTQLGLRSVYVEATLQAVRNMPDVAAWRILDGTHDHDPTLYKFLVRHPSVRGRRFSKHSGDFKKRRRAEERAARAFNKRYEKLGRSPGESGNPLINLVLLLGLGFGLWHWLVRPHRTPEPVSTTPVESVAFASPFPVVQSWRLLKAVAAPVPQGQVMVPAGSVVTVISRTESSAWVRYRGYEFAVAPPDLVPAQ